MIPMVEWLLAHFEQSNPNCRNQTNKHTHIPTTTTTNKETQPSRVKNRVKSASRGEYMEKFKAELYEEIHCDM
jgi:hypothetical protein